MKTAKTLLILSIVIFSISLALIILLSAFYIEKCITIEISINICIGILTGTIITFFTSITSYMLERNRIEKEIIYKALAIVNEIKKNKNIIKPKDIYEVNPNSPNDIYFMKLLEEYSPFNSKRTVKEICNKFFELKSKDIEKNLGQWIDDIGELIRTYLEERNYIQKSN